MIRATIVVALVFAGIGLAQERGGKLALTVSETVGIRRFSYPVHATITLPRPATAEDQYRLLDGDRAIAAQFRPVRGQPRLVALDFNSSVAPLEMKTYTIEYGPNVKPGTEPRDGLKVETTSEKITIRSAGMVYTVRRDLRGLLDEVRGGKLRYVKSGSDGLQLGTTPVRGDKLASLQIQRQGPLAVGLRFQTVAKDSDKYLAIQADLTFPRSKSWVEVDVLLRAKGMDMPPLSASLNLDLEGQPALVDFGAGSMVYTTLREKEAASLTARSDHKPAWEVRTGLMPKLLPFVVAPVGDRSRQAEGWAHLMDSKRCTALAIDEFGRKAVEDRILTAGDGRLSLTRTFGRGGPGERRLRFWLHFVPMPVQIGALTSPQSMMAPLAVEVKPIGP
jgi:hypothetical protein